MIFAILPYVPSISPKVVYFADINKIYKYNNAYCYIEDNNWKFVHTELNRDLEALQ